MYANKPIHRRYASRLLISACYAAILSGCGMIEAVLHDQFTTDPDYLRIKAENQAQKRRWLEEKEQASVNDDNGLSMSLDMLGVAAQNAANGGGRNAVAIPPSNGATNNNQSKPGKIANANCLKLESAGRDRLTIGDSERFVLRNTCSYAIAGAFCIKQEENVLSSGYNLCSRRSGNTLSLNPGEAKEVSGYGKSGTKISVALAACVAPSFIDVTQYGDPIKFRCVISSPASPGVR